MAIAKYEALSQLFRPGDYNVRVTVCNKDANFKECIRDSLGGGIIHSEKTQYVNVKVILSNGMEFLTALQIRGVELIPKIDYIYGLGNISGIRIDIFVNSIVRSWVIMR